MLWHNDQVSDKETNKIIEIARECLELPGDYVEMGCYKGDTSLLLAEVLRQDFALRQEMQVVEKVVEKPVKKLWIYDSFEGLPEKTDEDMSALGENFKVGELAVSKREVKERFLRAGLPVPVMHKGWFADLVEEDLPSEIAFAFLDGDLYESIRDCLRLVWDKMAEGGVIIVHDYDNPALPGVAKAVDEWVKDKKCKMGVFETFAMITVE